MAKATLYVTTKPLSEHFTDPALRAMFRRAEDDGTAPQFVEIEDEPKTLDGGAAAVREVEYA